MDRYRRIFLVGIFAVSFTLPPRAYPNEAETNPDQTLLRKERVGTRTEQLIAYLQNRSTSEVDLRAIETLIRELGAPQFRIRQQAADRLVGLGPAALPALREAVTNPDREVATTARKCIQAIEERKDTVLLPAVVRQLVRERPEGAMEALLGFLPFAADADLEEEIWFGLDSLAKQSGQRLQRLKAMREDKQPARRAAVAYLFGRRGDAHEREAAIKLLTDSDPLVRLRAAQGLLGAKEPAALPTLIGLLDGCPIELSWQAEEMLHWVAGDDAPEATVGTGTSQDREQCRWAWEQWWEKRASTLDLSGLYQSLRRPGLILMRTDLGLLSPGPKGSERKQTVWLCGCDGKPRWRVAVPLGLVQLLPGPRLLIMEPVAQRVTERDLAGAILRQWPVNLEAQPSGPPLTVGRFDPANAWTSGSRLANGNTFIAGSWQAVEFTPEGKELYNRRCGDRDSRYSSPQRLPNGHVLCILERGDRVGLGEFDPLTGKLVQEIFFSGWPTDDHHFHVQPLPNGHYLIASAKRQGIFELDATGRTCWQCPLESAGAVLRLRNGNFLVRYCGGVVADTYDSIKPEKSVVRVISGPSLCEVNQPGRVVWEVVRAGIPCLPVCLSLVHLGFDAPRSSDVDLRTSAAYRIKGLRSKDLAMRLKSAYELRRFRSEAAAAIPELIAALSDTNEFVRQDVAETLREVGPVALPELLQAAKDRRPYVRAAALTTFWRFTKEKDVILPVLLEAFRDESVIVRRSAVEALKSNLFIRRQAADPTEGLTAAEIQRVVAALVDALDDKDPARGSLARSTPEVGVPQLAAMTLADMGPQAKAAIPALIKKLKATDLRLRGSAIVAFRFIGPEARVAIPDLLETLEAKDVQDPTEAFYVRQAVLVTLDRLGHENPAAVSILTNALLDKHLQRNARQIAAHTLGQMGSRAKTAVPALVEAQKEADDLVGWEATDALKKIRHANAIP